MPEQLISHQWDHPERHSATAVSVCEVKGAVAPRLSRMEAPRWILDYEFRPYGTYRVNASRSPARPRLPRTAHLYPPGVAYWEDTRRARGLRHSAWITFSAPREFPLRALIHEPFGYARFIDAHGELGAKMAEATRLAHQRGDAAFWQVQACLAQALAMLAAAARVDGETYRVQDFDSDGDASDFVRRVYMFLRSHIGERVHLQDIAGHLHTSRSNIAHRYRQEAGETPMRTLVRLRIAHARDRPIRAAPLKVIAAQLAFNDAFHLSRAFKKIEGLSPRDYRRKLRREARSAPRD